MKNPPSNTDGKARIVVIDDHPLLCEGLIQLINRQNDMVVVGCGESVSEADAALEQRKPHLLLLDLRLKGGGDTIEFIKSVRARHSSVRVLVLSQHDEMLYADRCLRAGADGYITKEEAATEVITAIRCVLRGETYISRKVAVLVFHRAMESPPETAPKLHNSISNLTDRQLYVFQLLGAGLGSRQIAEEMKVSIKTVESHREHIKQKIGARDAVELKRMAVDWAHGNSGT